MGKQTAAADPEEPSLPAAHRAPSAALPPVLGLGLVVAAALWLFLPAIRAPFFADDFLFLDLVRGRSLAAVMAAPDPLSNFLRPVSRQVWFWLIAGTSHESPVAFHAANLAVFMGLVALMFLLGRRLAGTRAGLVAAAIVALHYSAAVPVYWACGSQELLAVSFALLAMLLHLAGRRALAAVALILAELSKEVVLVAPLLILVADHRPGERWMSTARRAWPLAAATLVWLLIWIAMPHRRTQQGTEVELGLGGILAALAHLPQVVFGLEWRRGEFGHLPRVAPPWGPLALALVAVAGAWPRLARAPVASADRAPAAAARDATVGHAIRVGWLWASLAWLPVAAVASLWSAHYYLFAMCGVALALGAWLSRLPRGWALAAITVLAWGSASARGLDEFAVARTPWTGASHINRFYLARATYYTERYLGDLQRLHPTLPPSSTLFFAGVKGSVAFLAGDGPLQRWAYRDPTLRSYLMSGLSLERVHRGPTFFFIVANDSLTELAPGPGLFADVALAMLVGDLPLQARDALWLEREDHRAPKTVNYWIGWIQWALDDRPAALAALRSAEVALGTDASAEVTRALSTLASGDTLSAIEIALNAVATNALDPGAHALLSDLRLARDPEDPVGTIEAFAARVLAPDDPFAWRRWAMVQAQRERYPESLRSFERYFALAGEPGRDDAEARHWVAQLRTMLPGAELDIDALRKTPVSVR